MLFRFHPKNLENNKHQQKQQFKLFRSDGCALSNHRFHFFIIINYHSKMKKKGFKQLLNSHTCSPSNWNHQRQISSFRWSSGRPMTSHQALPHPWIPPWQKNKLKFCINFYRNKDLKRVKSLLGVLTFFYSN